MKKTILSVILLLLSCGNLNSNDNKLVSKVKNIDNNLDLYKIHLEDCHISQDSLIITYHDSLGYYNIPLHTELVYLYGEYILEYNLSYIKYTVILSEGGVKKFLYNDIAIRENEQWNQKHTSYKLFVKDILKHKRNVNINILMYSFFLENMNNGNVLENNIFNLFKLYFSNTKSDFELAESYFEYIYIQLQTMSKNKEQFLDDYSFIRSKLNQYGNFRIEDFRGRLLD